MIKRNNYEQPSAELIEVKIERNIMSDQIQGKSIQTLEYDDDELSC